MRGHDITGNKYAPSGASNKRTKTDNLFYYIKL